MLCPGQTESGRDCRSPLIPLPDITPWWKRKKAWAVAGGIATFFASICTIYQVFFTQQAAFQFQMKNSNCYFLVPPDGMSQDITDGLIDVYEKNGGDNQLRCSLPSDEINKIITAGREGLINIIVKNAGKEPLKVDKIRVSSNQFSPMEKALVVDSGKTKTLPIQFKSTSDGVFEGILTLETNDPDTPVASIQLAVKADSSITHTSISDPWWVYQQLETSSNILRTEP